MPAFPAMTHYENLSLFTRQNYVKTLCFSPFLQTQQKKEFVFNGIQKQHQQELGSKIFFFKYNKHIVFICSEKLFRCFFISMLFSSNNKNNKRCLRMFCCCCSSRRRFELIFFWQKHNKSGKLFKLQLKQ